MKDERKGERLSDAIGGISPDIIGESREFTEERAKKARARRAAALILAGAVLITAIPLGVFFAKRGEIGLPDPEGINFNGGSYSGSSAGVPDELKTVSVKADGTDSKIIPTSGSFIIETAGDVDASVLAEYLTVTPKINGSLTKLSAGRFRLTPASGLLAPGQIYRMTVGDPDNPASSFAFQTENELLVSSTLPGDKTLNVPRDTGIEVTFSDAVTLDRKNDAPFTVTPSVGGKFMLYPDGRTVAFIPSSSLSYDTVYTISVSADVTGVSGKSLGSGYEFRFRTVTREIEALMNGKTKTKASLVLNTGVSRELAVSPGEDFTISGYVEHNYNSLSVRSVECVLYAFPSASAAAGALLEMKKSGAAGKMSSDGLERVASYENKTTDGSSRAEITVPAGLPKGIFLAVVTVNASAGLFSSITDTGTCLVQITDLRAATLSCDGETFLWLNRAGTGTEAGARVYADLFDLTGGWEAEVQGSTVSSSSDGDGICRIRTGDCNSALIRIESGDDALIVAASAAPSDHSDYYMNYVYTDREVYFSSDTVNYCGFITESFGGGVPDHLYLQTGFSTVKERVEVSEDGRFSGSIPLEDIGGGYYSLRFTDDRGRTVAWKYYSVTEESKPQYTASISFDKLFYRRNETMRVTLTASFFDGTPAEGLEFYLGSSHFSPSVRSGVTDKDGKIEFTVRTGHVSKPGGTYPISLSVTAELNGFETQTLCVSSSVLYFHSDYVIEAGGDQSSSWLTVNRRDTSGISSADDLKYPAFPGNTVGEPVSRAEFVSFVLERHTVIKEKKNRYNAYSKKNETYYEYHVKEETVNAGYESVIDGKVSFRLLDAGNGVSYVYKLSVYDETSGNYYTYSLNGTKGRARIPSDETAGVILNADGYVCGEKVVAEFVYGGEKTRAFYAVSGRGIITTGTGDRAEFEYTSEMIAGGRVFAFFFDPDTGKYYSYAADLPFDYGRTALSPEITTPKKEYRPGETATVSFSVPGAGGGFLIASVVDEACFALGDQQADPSSFFSSSSAAGDEAPGYSYFYYYLHGSRTRSPSVSVDRRFQLFSSAGSLSYYYRFSEGAKSIAYFADAAPGAVEAENGEPDGTSRDGSSSAYLRKFFADNPEYSVVELDSEGKGTLVFTVPDNITSWRITAVAVDPGDDPGKIRTGAAASDVVCTQPFFINLGYCEKYVYGDSVSVSARSYGAAAEGRVSYKGVLSDESGKVLDVQTAESDSKERGWLIFSKPEVGRYRITVYAECGTEKDALECVTDVIPTAVAAEVRRNVSAEEIKNIRPVYYPVTLSFANRTPSLDLYERIAGMLAYDTGAGRSDEYAALYIALNAVDKLYGTDRSEDAAEYLSLVSDTASQGSFALFPYASPDARLTAQIVSLGLPFKASVGNAIISTARGTVSKNSQRSPEELASALVTLAASGEAVLDSLYSAASVAGNWSPEAKLILALGFASAGDYPAAYEIYSQVKAEIAEENGEYGTLRLGGKTTEENIALTSLALMTAARVCRGDAAKLALWLCENRSEYESPRLALATYLKFFLPVEEVAEKEFSYSIGDLSEKITLGVGRGYTLRLSKSELEKLELDLPEGITVVASYRGSAEEALGGQADSSRVRITKKYEMLSGGICLVRIGVSGTSTRVSEYFELNDMIPSGARFFGYARGNYGSAYKTENGIRIGGWIYNRSGQNMTGGISLFNEAYWKKQSDSGRRFTTDCPEYSFDFELTYTIRGALEGECVGESAFIRNPQTGVFSVSERYGVRIYEKKNWEFFVTG